MKVKVQVQIDDGPIYNLEGTEKDMYKRDAEMLVKSDAAGLSLKFGDSGNTVSVFLQKVKNAAG